MTSRWQESGQTTVSPEILDFHEVLLFLPELGSQILTQLLRSLQHGIRLVLLLWVDEPESCMQLTNLFCSHSFLLFYHCLLLLLHSFNEWVLLWFKSGCGGRISHRWVFHLCHHMTLIPHFTLRFLVTHVFARLSADPARLNSHFGRRIVAPLSQLFHRWYWGNGLTFPTIYIPHDSWLALLVGW